MGLSNENRNHRTEQEILQATRDANAVAKRFMSAMKHTPNDNDHREYEAPSPAGSVHIRVIKPQPPSVGWNDADATRDHNEFVNSLGAAGKKFER